MVDGNHSMGYIYKHDFHKLNAIRDDHHDSSLRDRKKVVNTYRREARREKITVLCTKYRSSVLLQKFIHQLDQVGF